MIIPKLVEMLREEAKANNRGLLHAPADEITRLKQGIWDMAGIAGEDQDGVKTPDSLSHPDIVEYGKRAISQLRESYDEAIGRVF